MSPAPLTLSLARRISLFLLFLLISLGLGYPVLNRYDPRQTPGLSDVQSYAAMVVGATPDGPPHMRFRFLVPALARIFARLASGHLGTWNPVIFGLLFTDSLFVAATALFIVVFGIHAFENGSISLVAALLYLLNFAVPNLRLTGLVDAGEGFFLLAILWSLVQRKFWLLPLIAILGALTKESFIPFSIVFTATWWIVMHKDSAKPQATALWIPASWLISFTTFATLQWRISGHLITPLDFAASLHGNHEYLHHFFSSFSDRNFWYVFIWLLPAGIPHLKRLPRTWLLPTAATAIAAFVLDAYYGGVPGTVGRALFSIAGPVLALSSASWLCNWI